MLCCSHANYFTWTLRDHPFGHSATGQGPGPEGVYLPRPALDFEQERFHNMSPGDYEEAFIKAWDNETRKVLA